MRRPIFMLFDKIRRKQKQFNKEKIVLCATNDFALQFCYVARKNNFELEGVIGVDTSDRSLDYLKDYSDFPVLSGSFPDAPKTLVVLMLKASATDVNKALEVLKNIGYDAFFITTNDDILAVTQDVIQHSYLLDHIGDMLRNGFWDKSIFLRGLNPNTATIALTLKMKGFVVNGIILEDSQTLMQQFNFKGIPLITENVATQQKSGIVIDTLSDSISDELNSKHIVWRPRLADLVAIKFHWGFLLQFYTFFNMDTPNQNTDYEASAQAILSVYDRVTICFMDSERIGNMMETLIFVNQREDRKNLYAMISRYSQYEKSTCLLGTDQSANNFLLKKIKELCPIITLDKIDFWKYFIQHHAGAVEYTNDFGHFEMRMKEIEKFANNIYYVEKSPIIFSEEEENYGRQKMHDMGITGEYVTFFNRGSRYLSTNFGSAAGNALGCITRNSSVQSFSMMCQNLYQRGLQTVRMGYLVDGEIHGDGIIDYANNFREEILDYYLVAKSKFLMSDFSGMQIIALLFCVPLVITNLTQFSLDGDVSSHKSKQKDIMMLPKKLFDKGRRRFLSILEQLQLESQIPNRYEFTDYITSRGLEYVDNSPEEIWDAAEEMLLRLEGNIEYTPKELELQDRFQEALQECIKKSPTLIPNGNFVSTKFLLKNEWTLEL